MIEHDYTYKIRTAKSDFHLVDLFHEIYPNCDIEIIISVFLRAQELVRIKEDEAHSPDQEPELSSVREQRRYEIAKQYFDLVMVPDIGRYNPSLAKQEARRAVEYADALLAALESTK